MPAIELINNDIFLDIDLYRRKPLNLRVKLSVTDKQITYDIKQVTDSPGT